MAPGLHKTFSFANSTFRETSFILRSSFRSTTPALAPAITTSHYTVLSSSPLLSIATAPAPAIVATQRRHLTYAKPSPLRNIRTSNSKMTHASAASSRLKAIQGHIAPELNRDYSTVNGGIDFSVLPALMPGEGSSTTGESLWYVVAAATLLAFHHEPGVGQLWKYIHGMAAGRTEEEQAAIARRIRESCLKASVLVGFPRGINGLTSLHKSLETASPETHKLLGADTSLRAPIPPTEKFKRGKHFFSQIYSNHTDRILHSMGTSSGGDLSYFALSSVYGELMAEMKILNPMETVMLEFVCCLADSVAPQAKGHFFGCRNLGATGKQVKGAVAIVQEIARQLKLDVPGNGAEFAFLSKADGWDA